jgi:hypothetical protein
MHVIGGGESDVRKEDGSSPGDEWSSHRCTVTQPGGVVSEIDWPLAAAVAAKRSYT